MSTISSATLGTAHQRPVRPHSTEHSRVTDDEWLPDPAEVFTAGDLIRHLGRLRERGPGLRPAPRVGLTRLAALTSIPRSTLHTYVAGHTFPSAQALDSIVLALGCSPPQTREWAAAWERVAETSRGELAPSRSPHWSSLQRFSRGVSDWVEQTMQVRRRDFDVIAIAERAHVGQNRLTSFIDMRITVRARRTGAGRWFVFVPASPDLAHPELIDATALDQCSIGACRFHESQRAAVFELLLGEGLVEGDVHAFEFRLHHGRAAARAGELWGEALPPASTSVARGFVQQGSTYSLQVSFEREEEVQRVEQIFQSGPDAPREVIRPLRISPWGRATIALERPAAGLHGIGWTWREPDGPSDGERRFP